MIPYQEIAYVLYAAGVVAMFSYISFSHQRYLPLPLSLYLLLTAFFFSCLAMPLLEMSMLAGITIVFGAAIPPFYLGIKTFFVKVSDDSVMKLGLYTKWYIVTLLAIQFIWGGGVTPPGVF